MFTSSIIAASLLAVASASPAGNYYTPPSSVVPTSSSAAPPKPTLDPVVFNHEVKPVQAIPGLTKEQQSKTDKEKDPQWIQLTYNGGPYLEVYVNKLTYISGNASVNNAVNIWSINIAGGTGNYDGTQVHECKAFLDNNGVAPYGQAFGASDNSYLLGGGHKNEEGQRVAGPGIALRTVLCYAKGALAVPANSTTSPTGGQNSTSTCNDA